MIVYLEWESLLRMAAVVPNETSHHSEYSEVFLGFICTKS